MVADAAADLLSRPRTEELILADATRIGVIGAGRWGPHLIRSFQKGGRSRVVAVAEADEGHRARVARLHPEVEFGDDGLRLLTRHDLDAVVIATPTESHHRLAAAALDRGLHVFVEKPLARRVSEAEDLRDRAGAAGRVLFVGHVFLFNPAVRTARALIRSDELGRIHYLRSVRINLGPVRTDVSALWDLASHDISIFQFWLGASPLRATGKGAAYLNPGLEDVIFATLEYPGGVLANLHVTWLAPHKVREITVVGDRKMLVFDDRDTTRPLTLYDKRIAGPADLPLDETLAGFRSSIREGAVTAPAVAPDEPLAAECDHFLDCVRDGSLPVSGAAEGLEVVRILDGIERSMRSGSREIELAP
jgi:predicted dehydrogenase